MFPPSLLLAAVSELLVLCANTASKAKHTTATRLSASHQPYHHAALRSIAASPLALPIAVGLVELALYHLRTLHGRSVTTTRLDVALCLFQAFAALQLAKYLRRGHPPLTRPTYQASAVLRVLLTVAAYLFGSAALHAASVKQVHAFFYGRVLIWAFEQAGTFTTSQEVYAAAALGGAALAAGEGCGWVGPWALVLLGVGVAWASRWVSAEVARSRPRGWKAQLLITAVELGFAELETIKYVEQPKALFRQNLDKYETGFRPIPEIHINSVRVL